MVTKHAAFLGLAAAGAGLDLLTKSLVFAALGIPEPPVEPLPHEGIEIVPGWLCWRASLNRGIVWGLFQNWGGLFTVLSLLAVPVILLLYWRTQRPRWLFVVALGLILGGALGNLYDRLVYGKVRDFIDFYKIDYPIFNIADSMICIGVACLAWNMCFGAPTTAPPKSEAR